MKINYKCDMLVDQNRYIGDDPVGYKCMEDASFDYYGVLLCESCKDTLMKLPIPSLYGKDYQDKIIRKIITNAILPTS